MPRDRASKYDTSNRRKPGRPPTVPSIARIIVRLAKENPQRGYRGVDAAVRSRRPRLLRTRYLRRAKTITTMITMTTTVPIPIYMVIPLIALLKIPLELPLARRHKPPRAVASQHGRAQRGKDGGDLPVR